MQNALTLELDEEILQQAESLASRQGLAVEEFLAEVIIKLISPAG